LTVEAFDRHLDGETPMNEPTKAPATDSPLEIRKMRGMLMRRIADLDREINDELKPDSDDWRTALREKAETKAALAKVDAM